jgi:hypothetical protein
MRAQFHSEDKRVGELHLRLLGGGVAGVGALDDAGGLNRL